MDRLDAMAVLLAVVEGGSLSAASRQLKTPLPTVSRKISELERHLKTRLLNRSARQITLTDAGKSYVEACRVIVEQVDEAERTAMGEYAIPRGSLKITAPIVFGRIHLLPVALEFLKAYPEIDLRLVQSDHVLNLLEDRIDVAVRIGELADSSLLATRVGATRRVVCASPAYLAARGKPQKPEDLKIARLHLAGESFHAERLEVRDGQRREDGTGAQPALGDDGRNPPSMPPSPAPA